MNPRQHICPYFKECMYKYITSSFKEHMHSIMNNKLKLNVKTTSIHIRRGDITVSRNHLFTPDNIFINIIKNIEKISKY